MTATPPSPASLEALLEGWAVAHGATTALVVGDATEAARGLARHVPHVVVGTRTEADARLAERAMAGIASVEVRVGRDVATLPRCDLVVTVGELARLPDWTSELAALAERAARVLVVVVPNPRGLLDRLAGHARAPVCATAVIAPALWAAGRVREHVYFDVPSLEGLGSLSTLSASLPARVRATLARQHAFLVDTTPRTPQQARRRLHTV
jgi:hypothetical protein